MLHIGLALLAATGVCPASADEVAIRRLGQQFTEARQKNGRDALERVLHADYRGHRLPGRADGKGEMNRADAIALWTDPAREFVSLEYKTFSLRVLGATAVETGTMRVFVGWRNAEGGEAHYDERFVRVWMKDKDGWRVVHESY